MILRISSATNMLSEMNPVGGYKIHILSSSKPETNFIPYYGPLRSSHRRLSPNLKQIEID